MRILLATRLFFAALWDAAAAARLSESLKSSSGVAAPAGLPPPESRAESRDSAARRPLPPQPAPAPKPVPARSEALTLLAALQREARLIDIIKEPLQQYSDEQIGAAAREVLRDCAAVIERMFGIVPLVEQPEGSEIEVPRGYDPIRYRLSGKVSRDPPFRGTVVHHGWQATRCELPEWTGSGGSERVVAGVEVELK